MLITSSAHARPKNPFLVYNFLFYFSTSPSPIAIVVSSLSVSYGEKNYTLVVTNVNILWSSPRNASTVVCVCYYFWKTWQSFVPTGERNRAAPMAWPPPSTRGNDNNGCCAFGTRGWCAVVEANDDDDDDDDWKGWKKIIFIFGVDTPTSDGLATAAPVRLPRPLPPPPLPPGRQCVRASEID